MEAVPREPGGSALKVLPGRWMVKRSFAWIGRSRRPAKDYERKARTGECLMKVAIIQSMPARLGRG